MSLRQRTLTRVMRTVATALLGPFHGTRTHSYARLPREERHEVLRRVHELRCTILCYWVSVITNDTDSAELYKTSMAIILGDLRLMLRLISVASVLRFVGATYITENGAIEALRVHCSINNIDFPWVQYPVGSIPRRSTRIAALPRAVEPLEDDEDPFEELFAEADALHGADAMEFFRRYDLEAEEEAQAAEELPQLALYEPAAEDLPIRIENWEEEVMVNPPITPLLPTPPPLEDVSDDEVEIMEYSPGPLGLVDYEAFHAFLESIQRQ